MPSIKKTKISLREQVILFKQLGFFLKSGAALDGCLQMAAAGLPPKNHIRHFLEGVGNDTAAGTPLSQAFKNHTDSLSVGVLASIAAGEESGTLHTSVVRMGA